MSTGRFISLEGGEGVGKSTQVTALAEALRHRGKDVLVTREPGGSPGAEAIRSLLLSGAGDRWSMRAEALLFAAARADHVEKTIRPALAAGRWVLSDRFLDSSLAYQGGAGGLGISQVRALHRFGSEDFLPDRTLVLLLAEGVERARLRDRGESDRIGGRSNAYHLAVEGAFRQVAREEPGRVRLVDAAGATTSVTGRLLTALGDLL
ncbi:dTMP kinase [Sphingomonas sp. BN140010]|uniref:Thymidylate kinase n=1 Tax=Sphingomonas arvum TaxID=2992113 RepID=A0ABT3JFE3_9SPHN|nr:dTMP kinase [Sphingomonas sp. BN140010]MCW3797485.1 dTMP kinase [Sphingomonas sp. BN140010]